ncbi:FBW10 protein, partial [Sapayoa aenigma]|nr:FBW10 protein [Sapayoa aenigma]
VQEGPAAEENPPVFLADQDVTMVPASLPPHSEDTQAKDFTRCLPLQLSMYILGLLDEKSLSACADVNRHWAFLAEQVKVEQECRATVQKDFLQLKELCPRKTISNYAKRVSVKIPELNEQSHVIEVKDNNKRRKSKTERMNSEEFILHTVYRRLKTEKIQLEERNVFCGSYNTHVLMKQPDKGRIIHYSGGNLVAVASANRGVRLLGVPGVKEVPPLLLGHAGSIRALHLREKEGLLLTASFDLSIRCWNIHSGACMKIFNGHYGTITCLDSHKEQFVSGAGDGMVKVWSLKSGRCLNTLMHNSAVWAVKMDGAHVVSGCEQGLVKVWNADTGALIKTLEKHQGPVNCLSFDQWHVVTGSSDGFVLGWSMLGNLRKRLIAFFHPKEVLCLEFLYLRVISGCADGKIRVFNFLTGTCLKVLVVNSSGDPVSSLFVAENRMVINSPTRLSMFQFKDVLWDYSLPADREIIEKEKQRKGKTSRSSTQRQKMKSQSPKSRGTAKTNGNGTSGLQLPMLPVPQINPDCPRLSIPPWSHPSTALPKMITKTVLNSKCIVLFLGTDGEPEHGPAHPEGAEATLQPEQRKGPSQPMTLDKFLLTTGTLQRTCMPALVSSSVERFAKARESWEYPREHQQHHPVKAPMSKTLLQHKQDQTEQLQRARLHSESLTMKKISTPFETKMLRLKLENSLHEPTVKSSIPAPCVVRPKAGGLLGDKKVPSGPGKAFPPPKDGVQFIDLCRASSELIKPTRSTTAQMKNEFSRRLESCYPYTPDPFRRDSGFRLLTAEQAYEAATAAQCQAQTKPREDQERARKKAWLRKGKGLPVDSFTGERKTPAPELGYKVFI